MTTTARRLAAALIAFLLLLAGCDLPGDKPGDCGREHGCYGDGDMADWWEGESQQ